MDVLEYFKRVLVIELNSNLSRYFLNIFSPKIIILVYYLLYKHKKCMST